MDNIFSLIKTIYSKEWNYNDEEHYCYILENLLSKEEKNLIENYFETEEIDSNFRIETDSKKIKLFSDEECFRKKNRKKDFEKNIIIIKEKYSFINGDVYIDNEKDESDNFLTNAYYYHAVLDLLKKNEHKGDRNFYFVDYFSYDQTKFILTSISKVGQITFTFNSNYDLKNSISVKEVFFKYKNCLEDKSNYLQKFLKNEIFNSFITEGRIVKFNMLIEKSDNIINAAEQNLDIFLSEISLDDIKNEYQDYKSKYFSQLRDILNKITNQILAFPITISASAFATYKISDTNFTVILILVLFIAITFYSIFLFMIQTSDIQELGNVMRKDYAKLEKSDFFIKRPFELTDFKETKEKLEERIKLIKITHIIYISFISLVNSLFIVFLLFQLCHNLMISTVFLFITILSFITFILLKHRFLL